MRAACTATQTQIAVAARTPGRPGWLSPTAHRSGTRNRGARCSRAVIVVPHVACPDASAARWLGKAGGKVQFLALDDSFVFTKAVCKTCEAKGAKGEVQLTSWTAYRKGAPRKLSSSAAGGGEGKRSMLQRWGWYLMAAIAYFAYKAFKELTGGANKSA